MRLGCPGCGAQYEVGADAIPEAGREVTCSACGHRWFQLKPAPARPAPVPLPKPPARAPEDFRAFLREEAEREAAQRRRDGVPPPPVVSAPRRRRRRGFVTGIFLAVVPLGLLTGLYIGAPRLEREVPSLTGPLTRYTDQVDALRLQVHDWILQVRDSR
ncbi:zinc-ribbon domain-containing protein [Falsirhodobacter sp. 1013]|uniref:zinc-ribbon domain-containing protein n=1 Tax=Falsirhodobacter sp. 1013 TaxID=3417566 RepID=UPI003EBBBFB3